jgi:hypothetical protein
VFVGGGGNCGCDGSEKENSDGEYRRLDGVSEDSDVIDEGLGGSLSAVR